VRTQKRLGHVCHHLCASVSEEGGGEGAGSEAPSLLSYTRRYVSFAELDHVFEFGLRDPMYLCAYVSEEGGCQFGLREPVHLCERVSEKGGDGEGESSEATSLLSYTLRYVNLAECGLRSAISAVIHI
jgi:hypothetical protein